MPEHNDPLDQLRGLRDLGVSDPALDATELRVRAVLATLFDGDNARPSAWRSPRGLLRAAPGGLFVAASIAVTLAIGIGAVALLSHARRATNQPNQQAASGHGKRPKTNHLGAEPRFRPVSASVYEPHPEAPYANVELDRGSAAGVRINDPVIADGGLVGRISSVSRRRSVLSLITSSASTVTAEVRNRRRDTGELLAVLGRPGILQLRYLPRGARISDGQEIVTAGFKSRSLGPLYPAGIPVGRVIQGTNPLVAGGGQVLVAPVADLRHLRTVQILTRADNLTTLPAGGRNSRSANPTAAIVPGSPGRIALIDELAVLRRAQTRGDIDSWLLARIQQRDAAAPLALAGTPDVPLMRRVITPWGEPLYLLPMRSPTESALLTVWRRIRAPRPSYSAFTAAHDVETVGVYTSNGGGGSGNTAADIQYVGFDPFIGVLSRTSQPGQQGYQELIRVVPDDVSTVVFIVRGSVGDRRPGVSPNPRRATITATVHDNVAAARIHRPEPAGSITAIWYAKNGDVLRRSTWP